MIYIFLTILCSTSILILFRFIDNTSANTRHAIVINYLVASLAGVMWFDLSPSVVSSPWFWPAAIEGGVFYLVFRAMARTAQVNGVAAAGIATKMSVVIPVSVGIFFLNEGLTLLKLAGIVTGLIAVFLAAGEKVRFDEWKWPVISFFGIGLIDTSFKLFQVWVVTEDVFPEFITTIFGFAFAVGFLHHLTLDDRKMMPVSILSGAVIGLANFATVYFILVALALPDWESSVVFPITNFGIVLLSTLSALILFREHLGVKVWIGLGFAVVSIGMLYGS